MKFLSTPSARRATEVLADDPVDARFLSTPSARRATLFPRLSTLLIRISIHALREEGDKRRGGIKVFVHDFYPRPPRGGRPVSTDGAALGRKFLSTPSARRATVRPIKVSGGGLISIHALREEGDRHAASG